MRQLSLLFLLAFFLSACDSDSTQQLTENPIPTGAEDKFIWPGLEANAKPDEYGFLLDSAVEGLRYVSGGHYGVTSAEGKFGYIHGESTKFYIGNSLIGYTDSSAKLVTPLDFSRDGPFYGSNVLRILQSLDNDGDPNNGIQITQALHDLAASVVIEPQTIPINEIQPFVHYDRIDPDAIMELTSVTIAGPRGVVDGRDALNHFEDSLVNMINKLEYDIQSTAERSTCFSDEQCAITRLETRHTYYCPPPGPSIIYSKYDLDQLQFDESIAERKHLVELYRSIQSPDYTTGTCYTRTVPYILVCNASNHCEQQFF